MRKKTLFIAAALACCLALSGCDGISSDNYSASKMASLSSSDNAVESVDSVTSYDTASAGDGGVSETNPAVEEESKKIYTGSLEMETTAFSSAYNSIRQAAENNDGWLESDYTGTSGMDSTSYASLTIRVPVENFDALMEGLEGIENVTITSKNISTEDVSEDYYDIEGRLDNAKEKLKNLQKLSEEAENVSDMLTIEDSISDVQYTIEYLQGQINHYDSRISYSTVSVRLDEVNVLHGQEEGYGNKLITSLKSGFFDGIDFLGNVILWIAQNWLVLLVIFIVIAGFRKWKKKRKAKKTAKKETQKNIAKTEQTIYQDVPKDAESAAKTEKNESEGSEKI